MSDIPMPMRKPYPTDLTEDGTWKKLNAPLRIKVRKKAGREPEPTASILDSQSVKTTEEAETRGYDAGKKVKGRERHLLDVGRWGLRRASGGGGSQRERHQRRGGEALRPRQGLRRPGLALDCRTHLGVAQPRAALVQGRLMLRRLA